jgi:hypothetical protein
MIVKFTVNSNGVITTQEGSVFQQGSIQSDAFQLTAPLDANTTIHIKTKRLGDVAFSDWKLMVLKTSNLWEKVATENELLVTGEMSVVFRFTQGDASYISTEAKVYIRRGTLITPSSPSIENLTDRVIAVETAIVTDAANLLAHIQSTGNIHSVIASQINIEHENVTKTIQSAVDDIESELTQTQQDLSGHLINFGNPHLVTKTQVGLGNVDNTSDLNKPISTATQTALNNKSNVGHLHPISEVTGLQTALDSKIPLSQKGSAGGVATLDGNSKLPESQLPSFLFGGMRLIGTIGSNRTAQSLYDDAQFHISTNGGSLTGCYFLVSGGPNTSVVVTGGDDTANGVQHTFSFGPVNQVGEEDDNLFDDGVTLESGDWIVIGRTWEYMSTTFQQWAVVNNTYGKATSTESGIVKLGYTSNGKNEKVDTTSAGLFVNLDDYYDKTETYNKTETNGLLDSKVNTSLLGAVNGVATLDSDSKIPSAQLPDYVFGGLKFIGSINGQFGNRTLDELFYGGSAVSTSLSSVYGISSPFDVTTDIANRMKGSYYVVTNANMALLASSQVDYNIAVFDDGVDITSVGGANLEIGDWVIVSGYDEINIKLKFSIINNTYQNATTSLNGIVTLSNITTVNSSTTGNQVITQGVLGGLIGTAANTIAAGVHTHAIADVTNLQTSLNAKLNLTGGTLTGKLTVSADADNEQVLIRRFSNNNEQLILGFHSGDYAQIQAVEQSVGYRALSLNPNGGNVGIGITNPTQKLDVVGNIKASGSVTSATVSATTSVTTPSVVATSTVKIGAWVLSQNATSGSLDFVIG